MPKLFRERLIGPTKTGPFKLVRSSSILDDTSVQFGPTNSRIEMVGTVQKYGEQSDQLNYNIPNHNPYFTNPISYIICQAIMITVKCSEYFTWVMGF